MKMIVSTILVLTACIFLSCKKDQCEAGPGGQLTITAFPKHHSKPTIPLWAYVKFNTQELPGISPSDFDLVVAGDSTEDHIELENLNCGEYYIYMIAFDTAINDTVVGGIPFSTEQEAGEVITEVPVVE